MNTKTIKKYLPLAAIAAGCLYVINKGHVVSGVGGEFSPNAKLDYVLTTIRDEIVDRMGDGDREVALHELRRYKTDFPREIDYNVAQYGNLRCYYSDVENMYKDAGYKTVLKFSNEKLWDTYRRQVGYVVREMLAGRA